jgi:nucleoside-diphosphate-sugar epimerase
MKKMLITGASGFVGVNLVSFLEKNNQGCVLHNLRDSTQLDINGIFAVIHLAGKAHDLKKVNEFSEYYTANTELTKKVFDAFIISNANVFITISSVKSVADSLDHDLNENYTPKPITHYGKSKLLAEKYILSKEIPKGKRVYILRPCMIHGPGNKGNLNLLYKIVKKGLPWPLGAFENKRSFCSIDNLCFVIQELIEIENIPSGVYNIADDEPLSTNELIRLIAISQAKKSYIWSPPKTIIAILAKLGDLIRLPLNTERLNKLTESYVVSNSKIKQAINKPFPVSSRDGLLKTFIFFKNKS